MTPVLAGVLAAPVVLPVASVCARRIARGLRGWRCGRKAARLVRAETCPCDVWWTTFGRRHSPWCLAHPRRSNPS
jgi:hypothetical protein